MMRKIVFRVDSSAKIGIGHLMRCLTLAEYWKEKADIFFLSRQLEGNSNNLIEDSGYSLLTLPIVDFDSSLVGYEAWLTVKQEIDAEQCKEILTVLKPDYLVIDHYALDEYWEKIMRIVTHKIMVLDDLANRKHDCDILLDQNDKSDFFDAYNDLVPKHCTLLIGPKYALLRQEFYDVKPRRRDGTIKNIFIFFGGSDLTNETWKVLQAIEQLNRTDITVNVVVGNNNQNKEQIRFFCSTRQRINYFCQINHMAKLMQAADLAIGAGGTTTWERCILGLPTIVITVADNQEKSTEDLAKRGVLIYLGRNDQVTKEQLVDKIQELMQESTVLNLMQQECFSLMQENKGLKKIVNIF